MKKISMKKTSIKKYLNPQKNLKKKSTKRKMRHKKKKLTWQFPRRFLFHRIDRRLDHGQHSFERSSWSIEAGVRSSFFGSARIVVDWNRDDCPLTISLIDRSMTVERLDTASFLEPAGWRSHFLFRRRFIFRSTWLVPTMLTFHLSFRILTDFGCSLFVFTITETRKKLLKLF